MSDPTAGTEPGGADLEWLVLDPDEEVLWQGRPRIQTTFPAVTLTVLAAVGAIVATFAFDASPVVFSLPIVFLAGTVWFYLSVRRTAFAVTTDAVYRKSGVLGIDVIELGLDRVQNTASSQHALGALFGYGTVTIDSAGGGDVEIRFWNVEDPTSVRALVDRRAESAGEDEVPGTLEEWEAVLAEVKRWRGALERVDESG